MDESISVDKGDLVNGLLGKCEAKNLPEVYNKYLLKAGDICSFKKLLSFSSYFTPENIKKDLGNDSNIIIIFIYNDVLDKISGIYGKRPLKTDDNGDIIPPKKENEGRNISKLTECVVNFTGLAKIILSYKKLGYFPKEINLNKMIESLKIRSEESEKFKHMIKDLVDNRVLFAVLENFDENESSNGNNINLRFTGKFGHPSNKKLVIQLVVTIIIMVTMLAILSKIIRI